MSIYNTLAEWVILLYPSHGTCNDNQYVSFVNGYKNVCYGDFAVTSCNTYVEYNNTGCGGASITHTASSSCSLVNDTQFSHDQQFYYAQMCTPGGSESHSNECFHGDSRIAMADGTSKLIKDVVVGDMVIGASGKPTAVVSVPHDTNDISTMFVTIGLKSGGKLSLTPMHLIQAGACANAGESFDLMYAKEVKAGMCVHTSSRGVQKVAYAEPEMMSGIYSIVTNEEYIVVNDMIASPFAYNHKIAHYFYHLHRFAYALTGKTDYLMGMTRFMGSVVDTIVE